MPDDSLLHNAEPSNSILRRTKNHKEAISVILLVAVFATGIPLTATTSDREWEPHIEDTLFTLGLIGSIVLVISTSLFVLVFLMHSIAMRQVESGSNILGTGGFIGVRRCLSLGFWLKAVSCVWWSIAVYGCLYLGVVITLVLEGSIKKSHNLVLRMISSAWASCVVMILVCGCMILLVQGRASLESPPPSSTRHCHGTVSATRSGHHHTMGEPVFNPHPRQPVFQNHDGTLITEFPPRARYLPDAFRRIRKSSDADRTEAFELRDSPSLHSGTTLTAAIPNHREPSKMHTKDLPLGASSQDVEIGNHKPTPISANPKLNSLASDHKLDVHPIEDLHAISTAGTMNGMEFDASFSRRAVAGGSAFVNSQHTNHCYVLTHHKLDVHPVEDLHAISTAGTMNGMVFERRFSRIDAFDGGSITSHNTIHHYNVSRIAFDGGSVASHNTIHHVLTPNLHNRPRQNFPTFNIDE